MNEEIEMIVERLDAVKEDLNSKPRAEMDKILEDFHKLPEEDFSTDLLKLQDDLEALAATGSIDQFARTEISEAIKELEQLL